MSTRSIHVFASDALPFPGCPRTAGGNRSMQVISALRKAGHHVTFSYNASGFIPQKWADQLAPHLSDEDRWCCEHYMEPEVVLNRIQPDVAIYCNVNTFQTVRRFARDVIHIVDLNGPVHFESLMMGDGENAGNNVRVEKECRQLIERLRSADHIVTVSERQKYFWLAYCSLAGFGFSELDALVCPFCFEVDAAERKPSASLRVVHGGGFYPWQNPERFLRAAAHYLDEIPEAELHIAGGPHAGLPNERQVEQLIADLKTHRSVRYHGFLPIEKFNELLSTAWAALDLMDRSVERELAINGRTLQFLATGVPLIYNSYSTLSEDVREYRAGWTIQTDVTEGLKAAFDELVQGGLGLVEELSANARRLSSEKYDPLRAMQPLVDLCGSVTKRTSLTKPVKRRSTELSAPVGRVLAICPDPGPSALAELRMNNPLRALHRQRMIDGFVTAGPACERLAKDNSFYDVIFIQRAVRENIYLGLANLGLPYLLDIDDNLLARAHYRNEDPEFWLYTGLAHASAVSAPNPRLIRLLEKYSGLALAGHSYITPNALPFGSARAATQPTQPKQIIWIQSDIAALSNSREAVVRVVEDFSRKYSLPITLVGRNVLERPRFTHQVVMGQIDFNSNLQLLATAPTSIGIAPLETNADTETVDFICGKSDLKILLFAGYGHACVVSDSPPYTDSPLRDCATITSNSYDAWMQALEHAYREGWKAGAPHAERIQDERNIDRIARESWGPAIEACVLPKQVRGADLFEALTSYDRMDPDPADAVAYLVANPDVGREFVNSENGAWEHYKTSGHKENRSVTHNGAAHDKLLTQLDKESDHLYRRGLQESARLSYLNHEIRRLQAEVQDLRTSLSWKITAPLRTLAKPIMSKIARSK